MSRTVLLIRDNDKQKSQEYRGSLGTVDGKKYSQAYWYDEPTIFSLSSVRLHSQKIKSFLYTCSVPISKRSSRIHFQHKAESVAGNRFFCFFVLD